MPVKININTAKIAMDITAASKKAVAITAGQILADCNTYCPEDQGMLKNSAEIHSELENGKLVWSTPYARFLYHGALMVDPKTGSSYAREGQTKEVLTPEVPLEFDKTINPNAGSHWCERAYAEHHEDWEDIFRTSLKKELNDGNSNGNT